MENDSAKKIVKADVTEVTKKMTIAEVNKEVEKLRAAGHHTMTYGKYVEKYGVQGMEEYVNCVPRTDRRLYECDLPLEQYIRWKINILENQFYIRLNYADYEHFENCKSHAAVDSYARKLFNERL